MTEELGSTDGQIILNKNKRRKVKNKCSPVRGNQTAASAGSDNKSDQSTVRLSNCIEDYVKAWKLLAGHAITNTVKSKKSARIFDGELKTVEELAQLPACTLKKGMFISRQTVNEAAWKSSSVKEWVSIVIECDDGLSEKEQIERFMDSGIPYSFLVWSGNKSVHCWIIFDAPIREGDIEFYQGIISKVFPAADKSVIDTPNKLARFPVSLKGYEQPLLDFRGAVKADDFEAWTGTVRDQKEIKNAIVQSESSQQPLETSNTLRRYWEENGKKDRMPCPVCKEKGKDTVGRNLCVQLTDGGRLIFYCFRCKDFPEDDKALKKRFFVKSKSDPNIILDKMLEDLSEKVYCDSASFNWYQIDDHPMLLRNRSDQEIERLIWPIYEKASRQNGGKILDKSFREIVRTIGRSRSIEPWNNTGEVALRDGSVLRLNDFSISGKLVHPANFFLPFKADEIGKQEPTPVWDAFIAKHATCEDGILLRQIFGFIFSGEPIRKQGCMLILFGPRDTGKSVIVNWLKDILADHSTIASVSDCLTKPVMAVNILGKRLAVSSESAILARDGARFRSLISAEELSVKNLFRNEITVTHNAFFISSSNEIGWIEDSEENRKRIRAIEWTHTVSDKEMDHNLLDKLLQEAPSFIVHCLRAYLQVSNARLPFTESTTKFMTKAGQNINPVAAWMDREELQKGETFNPTEFLFQKFRTDTNSRMDLLDFARKLSKLLGEEGKCKASNNGKERRGYLLNKTVSTLDLSGISLKATVEAETRANA